MTSENGGDAGRAPEPGRRLRRPPPPYRPRARWTGAGTWSKGAVRAAILDWHAELGRPPLSYEWASPGDAESPPQTEGMRRWQASHPRWPSQTTVLRYYGSWGEALEDAGLPVRRLLFDAPFEERVLAARQLSAEGRDVAAIAEQIGVKPRTVTSYLRAGPCARCGGPFIQSVSGLCRHCAHLRSSWSREEIVAAMGRWTDEEGRPPTKADWAPSGARWRSEFPSWPSVGIVAASFGSWNDALIAAGSKPRGRTWSAEQIVIALRSWAASHGGRPPAYGDWRKAGEDHPGVTVVADRFGSWRAALVAAGLTPRHRRWTREEVISALRGSSHSPRDDGPRGEPDRVGDLPPRSTVRRLFGSWDAALRAAGIPPRRRRWTRDDVTAALRSHVAEHGRLPTQADWTPTTRDHPSPGKVASLFGSWRRALATASRARLGEWTRDASGEGSDQGLLKKDDLGL